MPSTRSRSKAVASDVKAPADKSIGLFRQSEFNWLAFKAPTLPSSTLEKAFDLIGDSFDSLSGDGATAAGVGTLDSPHVTVLYGTDVKWFDEIKAMAEELKLTEDDFTLVGDPYLLKPKFPSSEGAYAICQDLECPKITKLKRAIETKFDWKNPTEVAEKREIPLHVTLYVIDGQVKDGLKPMEMSEVKHRQLFGAANHPTSIWLPITKASKPKWMRKNKKKKKKETTDTPAPYVHVPAEDKSRSKADILVQLTNSSKETQLLPPLNIIIAGYAEHLYKMYKFVSDPPVDLKDPYTDVGIIATHVAKNNSGDGWFNIRGLMHGFPNPWNKLLGTTPYSECYTEYWRRKFELFSNLPSVLEWMEECGLVSVHNAPPSMHVEHSDCLEVLRKVYREIEEEEGEGDE